MSRQDVESCFDACSACADASEHCLAACLRAGDLTVMADCIRLDLDCAAISRLTAGFVGRGSPRAAEACRLCADICEACAEECAKHEDDHCQRCADACRTCATECRNLAG